MTVSYYSAPLSEFSTAPLNSILGRLSSNYTRAHALGNEQVWAWHTQVEILKRELSGLKEGSIHFEFVIPRMGKRADCVILTEGVVFVLEFKVGAAAFHRADVDQAHDYALDLKNFHRGSHTLPFVPILVATQASSGKLQLKFAADQVAEPLCVGASDLGKAIEYVLDHCNGTGIDYAGWSASGYQPTPTIIEAAQALYQSHDVHEIARSDAGARNLQATSARIAAVIEHSKRNGRKSICFVTGVPGAGKTLAGLNIAATRSVTNADEHAVFLSDNGPLVDVLREALARDQAGREGLSRAEANRRVCSFVQNIHHFRDHYLTHEIQPDEKVVVF